MRVPSFVMLAGLGILLSTPVWAHRVTGPGVFINTLTTGDPVTVEEAWLPTPTWPHAGAGENCDAINRFDFALNKGITANFGFGTGDGHSLPQQADDQTRGGWHNLAVSLKYQANTRAEHDLLMSLGVIRLFGRTGSANIASGGSGPNPPAIYFGKGLEGPPIGHFGSAAVTGTLGYQFGDGQPRTMPSADPETCLAAFSFNNGTERTAGTAVWRLNIACSPLVSSTAARDMR